MNKTISDVLHELFYLGADVRTRDKFLMGNPVPVVTFVIVYVLISIFLPPYMKKRGKYYEIKNPLMILDFYLASASIYLLTRTVKYMIWSNYDFRCMALDLTTRKETLEVISFRTENRTFNSDGILSL